MSLWDDGHRWDSGHCWDQIRWLFRARNSWVIIAVIVVAALFLISAYGCASQPAQPVEIQAPAPDFYDRNGVPCWRFTDMIWCEDGYESTEDKK